MKLEYVKRLKELGVSIWNGVNRSDIKPTSPNYLRSGEAGTTDDRP